METKYIIGIVITLVIVIIVGVVIYYESSSSSSSSSSSDNNGGGTTPSSGCGTGAGCTGNQICATVNGQQMCQTHCATDDDCDNGNTCVNNACSCNSGAECVDGNACNGTSCQASCVATDGQSNPCASNMICNKDTGLCSCNGNTCTSAEYCNKNESGSLTCNPLCGTKSYSCDLTVSSCTEINGVTDCYLKCGGNAPCSVAGTACNTTSGSCEQYCGTDTNFCTSDQTCVNNVCETNCTSGGTYCSDSTKVCNTATNECWPNCGGHPCNTASNGGDYQCVYLSGSTIIAECKLPCSVNTNGEACPYQMECTGDYKEPCDPMTCGSSPCPTEGGVQKLCSEGSCYLPSNICVPSCESGLTCINNTCQLNACDPQCAPGTSCVSVNATSNQTQCINNNEYCHTPCKNTTFYTCVYDNCYFKQLLCPSDPTTGYPQIPGANQICYNNEIITKPTSCTDYPFICTPGQYCLNGACQDVKPCTASSECDSGYTCIDGYCMEQCLMTGSNTCTDSNASCISLGGVEYPYGIGDNVILNNEGICAYINSTSTGINFYPNGIICDSEMCPTGMTCDPNGAMCVYNNQIANQYNWVYIDITNTSSTNCSQIPMPLGCFSGSNNNMKPNVAGRSANVVTDSDQKTMYFTPVVFELDDVSETATCPLKGVPMPGAYVDSNDTSFKTGFTTFNINEDPNNVFVTVPSPASNNGQTYQWDINGNTNSSYNGTFKNCKVTSAAYLTNNTVSTQGGSLLYTLDINSTDYTLVSPTDLLWYKGMPIFLSNAYTIKSTGTTETYPSAFNVPVKYSGIPEEAFILTQTDSARSFYTEPVLVNINSAVTNNLLHEFDN